MIQPTIEELNRLYHLANEYKGIGIILETSGGLSCNIQCFTEYEYYFVKSHGSLVSVSLRANGVRKRFARRLPSESDLVLFSLESMLT